MLHPTSLPDGRLGESAYEFVDWLEAAGQSWWQVLPLGPPDDVGSPYASASAFAAWSGFLAEPSAPVTKRELARSEGGTPTGRATGRSAGGDLADQVRFQREWTALRDYARARGVRLIGDVPIYVAWGSVDHRSHPELFLEGLVAGAPPDRSALRGSTGATRSSTGTRSPREGYRWWIERLRRTFELFDLTRIDHFRGFAAFWAIPEASTDAREGAGCPAPATRCSAPQSGSSARCP